LYNADQSKRLTLRHDNTQSRVISSDGNLSLEVPPGNTVTVEDAVGAVRKVGIRNPVTFNLSANANTIQDWEGRILVVDAAITLTLDQLETDTTMRVITEGGAASIVAGAGVTIKWFSGGQLRTGNRTLAIGSVMEIIWELPSSVYIFGNGIT